MKVNNTYVIMILTDTYIIYETENNHWFTDYKKDHRGPGYFNEITVGGAQELIKTYGSYGDELHASQKEATGPFYYVQAKIGTATILLSYPSEKNPENWLSTFHDKSKAAELLQKERATDPSRRYRIVTSSNIMEYGPWL